MTPRFQIVDVKKGSNCHKYNQVDEVEENNLTLLEVCSFHLRFVHDFVGAALHKVRAALILF